MNVLLLAALAQEAHHSLTDKYGEENIHFTGIGKINAAASAARLLADIPQEQRENTLVLNFGTCGSSVFKVGDVFSVWSVSNSGCDMVHYYKSAALVHPRLCGAHLLSSDEFVSTQYMPEEKVKSLQKQYSLFDMEMAAISRVCDLFNVKWASLKVVSDDMKGTIKQWDEVVSNVSPALAKRVVELVEHVEGVVI